MGKHCTLGMAGSFHWDLSSNPTKLLLLLLDGCPNLCSRHGLCVAGTGAPEGEGLEWRCQCEDGWGGRDCSAPQETNCNDEIDNDNGNAITIAPVWSTNQVVFDISPLFPSSSHTHTHRWTDRLRRQRVLSPRAMVGEGDGPGTVGSAGDDRSHN